MDARTFPKNLSDSQEVILSIYEYRRMGTQFNFEKMESPATIHSGRGGAKF